MLRNISETENTSRKLPLPTPRKFRLGHLQTKVRQVKELISNSCRGSKSISRSLRWLGFCCCLFVLFLFLHNCLDQESLEPLRRHTDDITGFLAPWTLPFFWPPCQSSPAIWVWHDAIPSTHLKKTKLLSDRWGSWPWARAVIEFSSQGVDRKTTEGPPRSAYNELSKHLNRHGGCEQMFWWRACENLLFTAPLWPGLWNLRKFPVPAGISVIYWLQYNGDFRN